MKVTQAMAHYKYKNCMLKILIKQYFLICLTFNNFYSKTFIIDYYIVSELNK